MSPNPSVYIGGPRQSSNDRVTKNSNWSVFIVIESINKISRSKRQKILKDFQRKAKDPLAQPGRGLGKPISMEAPLPPPLDDVEPLDEAPPLPELPPLADDDDWELG